MKIALIFSTRRKKATTQVVEWMLEEAKESGFELEVFCPSEISNFDYDLFILGSSVYGGQVQGDMLEFIQKK